MKKMFVFGLGFGLGVSSYLSYNCMMKKRSEDLFNAILDEVNFE